MWLNSDRDTPLTIVNLWYGIVYLVSVFFKCWISVTILDKAPVVSTVSILPF